MAEEGSSGGPMEGVAAGRYGFKDKLMNGKSTLMWSEVNASRRAVESRTYEEKLSIGNTGIEDDRVSPFRQCLQELHTTP